LDRQGGLVFEDEGLTVGKYLDKWLEGSLRGAVRQTTFDRYEIAVRVHIKPVLGRLKLTKLAPTHLAGFYQDKLAAGFAPASVTKLHVALHKALDQAVKWHMIPRNVAEVVKAPRPAPEEIRPLSKEQTKTLLKVAKGEDRFEALYVLAVTTGLRQGELLGLKWEDADLEDGVVQVRRTLARHKGRLVLGEPKTKRSRRTLRLTEAAVKALEGHLARQRMQRDLLGELYEYQGLVFATQKGTLMNPTNLRKRSFEPLLEKAGLPAIRFHDLRHTCATLLLSRNVNPKIVSEMLGHATIAITLDTYSHVLPNMQEGAARALEETLR
jgi:integrase